MADSTPEKITLGFYMWSRLHQVGISTIFGVPGDFNLQFLDAIYTVPGLRFVTNQNELNAAYAADGYARVKGVPGCLVTTHGVGELSALNGVAGAMSEHVKMVHVVGQTTRAMQKNRMMIHPSIGRKPDHQAYNRCSEPVRFAAAELWDADTAPAEIDRVIRECFIKSGPVYIFLPLDLSAEQVDAALLNTPIDTSPHINEAAQSAAVDAITSALRAAKHPSLLIDALVHRFDAVPEATALVNRLAVPFFSANMGKGLIDEDSPHYVGVWYGAVGTPGVRTAAEAADLVITLGHLPADTNSGGFSRAIEEGKTIHIDPHSVTVFGREHPDTSMKSLVAALVAALPSTPQHQIPHPTLPPPRIPRDRDAQHMTQSRLWPQLESYLRPGDIIAGETGTFLFGLCDIKFHRFPLVSRISTSPLTHPLLFRPPNPSQPIPTHPNRLNLPPPSKPKNKFSTNPPTQPTTTHSQPPTPTSSPSTAFHTARLKTSLPPILASPETPPAGGAGGAAAGLVVAAGRAGRVAGGEAERARLSGGRVRGCVWGVGKVKWS